MKISQILICQFSQHIIRLMKNFRQMRNAFLINSFRYKSKILENQQNNARKSSYKGRYPKSFPMTVLFLSLLLFLMSILLTSRLCSLWALQEQHHHLKHILSMYLPQWYLLHQTQHSHLLDKLSYVLVLQGRLL